MTNSIAKKLSGDNSASEKKQYLKDRLFLTPEIIKNNYLFFYQHKILLPFLYLHRFMKAAFVKPKKILREYKELKEFDYAKNEHANRSRE